MAYTIRYAPKRSQKKRRLFMLSACFFVLFLLLANMLFSEQLTALRDLIISPALQEAVAAFCDNILDHVD